MISSRRSMWAYARGSFRTISPQNSSALEGRSTPDLWIHSQPGTEITERTVRLDEILRSQVESGSRPRIRIPSTAPSTHVQIVEELQICAVSGQRPHKQYCHSASPSRWLGYLRSPRSRVTPVGLSRLGFAGPPASARSRIACSGGATPEAPQTDAADRPDRQAPPARAPGWPSSDPARGSSPSTNERVVRRAI